MRKVNHIHPGGATAAPGPRLRAVAPATALRPPPAGESSARLRPGAEGNAADDYLSRLQPNGRRSMRSRLDRAARMLLAGSDASTFPWDTLRYEDVSYVCSRLTL